MYYRGAAAAIVVYDITRQNTFKTLKTWIDELQSQGPKDIAIAIAGNKADLADQRDVDRNIAQAYAEEIGAMYLETSAKDDLNVQDIFIQLSKFLSLFWIDVGYIVDFMSMMLSLFFRS